MYFMLITICPKLPMINKAITKNYYVNSLGFIDISAADYDDYLLLQKDNIELHFFKFEALNPAENYGQVYIRTKNIEALYNLFLTTNVPIHPNGNLALKPWGQTEFSLLDPNNNLLTFGHAV